MTPYEDVHTSASLFPNNEDIQKAVLIELDVQATK